MADDDNNAVNIVITPPASFSTPASAKDAWTSEWQRRILPAIGRMHTDLHATSRAKIGEEDSGSKGGELYESKVSNKQSHELHVTMA